MDRNELFENLTATEEVVLQMEQIDEKIARIRRVPIRLGWPVHFTICVVLFVIPPIVVLYNMFFDLIGVLPYVTISNMMIISAGAVASYWFIVLSINMYVLLSKRWLYREEVLRLTARRAGLADKLRKVTFIPPDYWKSKHLQRMQTYLLNGRADNLKESLNLLESELRHEQLTELLGVKFKK